MIDLARGIEIYRRHCADVDVHAGDPASQVIDRGSYFFFSHATRLIGTIGVIV